MVEEISRIFASRLKEDGKNIEKMRFDIEKEMYSLIVEMLEKKIELPEQSKLFLARKLRYLKEELAQVRTNYEKDQFKDDKRNVRATLRNLHRKICEIEEYRETDENSYFRETIEFLRPIYEVNLNSKTNTMLLSNQDLECLLLSHQCID